MVAAHSVDAEVFGRNGFGGPYYAMTGDEAQEYRRKFEAYEAELGRRVTEGSPDNRFKTHLLLPFAADLVRHPRILDAVETLLGPDILCWTSTWFVKDSKTEAQTIWHQDATYFGLRPHLACHRLAGAERGFGRGRLHALRSWHEPRRAAPATSPTPRPTASTAPASAPRSDFPSRKAAVPVPLKPGEFSIHHTLAVHASGPNRSRRPAHRHRHFLHSGERAPYRQHVRVPATLVQGRGPLRPFRARATPGRRTGVGQLPPPYRAAYSESYAEQVEWHAEGRWE